MAHFFDYSRPNGYLEITKIQDGVSEVIFSDYNDICIGMGQTLAGLFDPANVDSAGGPKTIQDFQIGYFQLGKGTGTDGSATRALTSPFNGADYGTNTNLSLDYRYVYKATPALQAMAVMSNSQVTPGSDDRITFSINLGSNDANTTLSEIAMLSNQPITGLERYSPIVAYRTFPTITKTTSFSLNIKWTIEF